MKDWARVIVILGIVLCISSCSIMVSKHSRDIEIKRMEIYHQERMYEMEGEIHND